MKNQTLYRQLVLLGPDGLGKFLRPARGFRISGSVHATAGYKCFPEHRVVVQSVQVVNRGRRKSAALNELDCLYLSLAVTLKDRPFALTFGGMAGVENTGSYPPPAYRPTEVTFGAMPTNKTAMNPLRWWSGHRHLELGSNAAGQACSPHLPIAMLGWHADGDEMGLWFALEWSGQWKMEILTEVDGTFVVKACPLTKGITLAPGESLVLPAIHVGVFGGKGQTREDGTNSIRRYIRDTITPNVEGKRPQALLAYDHWMGIHGDISERLLRRQAVVAAKLGLEYFVVDAGWFAGTRAWFNSVGNWERVDRKKFPHGLEPLAQFVKEKGLKFGLWFEPERAAAGSDWAVQHPRWFLSGERPGMLNLDISRRDAQDGLLEMLSGYIQRLDIRWLRWDYNQGPAPYWHKADPTGKIQFAYVAGLYRVWDELLARHPNLMVDLGWRMDFGSMRRSATTIMADYAEDPHIVRIMQTGGARVIPANCLNGFTYQGKDDDLLLSKLAMVSRMAGSLTLGGRIHRYVGRDLRTLKRYLDGYRRFRHLLTEDFYALTPMPLRAGELDIVEFCDPHSGEAVVLVYAAQTVQRNVMVRPRGLKSGHRYRVIDPFTGRAHQVANGSVLMRNGFGITVDSDTAQAFILQPIEK